VLIALVAALCLPGVACSESIMHFSLPATQGYAMQVRTEGDSAEVSLWKKTDERRVEVTYFVPDAVGPGVIDADLGPLGAIHLRFVPSGETRVLHLQRGPAPPGCRVPRRLRLLLGSFEGSVSFRGEMGFAAAEASRASGSIGPSARRRCRWERSALRRAGAPGANVERVWLKSDAVLFARDASSGGETSMTWLGAWTTARGVRYAVDRFERLPAGLIARRSATVAGPTGGFSYHGDLAGAVLAPPPPFSGEATYWERRHRLDGDLAVALPGIEPQRLTGPRFEARATTLH
jgi:hypothetical protein